MSEASLHQSLSQQQALAPQMRKSLEILQANTLELGQLVQQALETNPTLEVTNDMVSLDSLTPDASEDAPGERISDTADDWRERSIHESRSNTWSADDEARRDHLYNSIVAPQTLQQHLLGQLNISPGSPTVREAVRVLIGNLDERGFLDLPPRDLAIRFGIGPDDLRNALSLLRSFEPPGIGAENLKESLLLQLKRSGEADSIEYRIIASHLDDFARKRYPQIARALSTTPERIADAADRIRRLNPNPGGDFDPTANPHVLPDVIIERDDDGEWTARLTNEHLPDLKISDHYKDLLGHRHTDANARQWLRDRIRDGRALIHALSLRQSTIAELTNEIIKRQGEFLRHGPKALRPMTMSEIADALGVHATTISRAVAGKSVLTPHGLMELRSFFATGYQNTDGSEVSNAAVREALQALISHEPSDKPLSDDALAKLLAERGLTVARRTVAKYREQLGILPSHLRKTY
jgi:RNA polymerase sigma-54 factor